MRGHEPLIAMRRRGVTTPWVYLDAQPVWLRMWDGWGHEGRNAHVELAEHEPVNRVDLRFVAGLTCWVDGYDESRRIALGDACKAHGAARVIVGGVSDTEGILWPK